MDIYGSNDRFKTYGEENINELQNIYKKKKWQKRTIPVLWVNEYGRLTL